MTIVAIYAIILVHFDVHLLNPKEEGEDEMKKMMIILMAMAMILVVSFPVMADEGNPSVPVKRMIAGDSGMSVIRTFSNWHNIRELGYPLVIEQFNSWDDENSWMPIDLNEQDRLEGIYRFTFDYRNTHTIRGFVGANDGGTGFQTISMDSLLNNFTEDPMRLYWKIKRIARGKIQKNSFVTRRGTLNSLTVWMAYNTEGLSVVDTDYAWDGMIDGYDIIAVLPCNSNGYVDIHKISQGDRKISLSDEVPHFLILSPSD